MKLPLGFTTFFHLLHCHSTTTHFLWFHSHATTSHFFDFAAFHHIDLAHFIDEAILADYPRLRGFMAGMRGLSGVSAYLAERPELIGVGVGPKLVIDGVPVPTGITAD